jgi:hypothetical protein
LRTTPVRSPTIAGCATRAAGKPTPSPSSAERTGRTSLGWTICRVAPYAPVRGRRRWIDLRSREGPAEFLAWTRAAARDRLRDLAEQGAADVTCADWAGSPRLEPWTPRKAARRLVWHELLRLRAIGRFAAGGDEPP